MNICWQQLDLSLYQIVHCRYSNLQYIGEGAYGMVVSAYDNQTKTKVSQNSTITSLHSFFLYRLQLRKSVLLNTKHIVNEPYER